MNRDRLRPVCSAAIFFVPLVRWAIAAAQVTVPPGWSPELGEAMRAYDAGEYGAVLRECTRVLSTSRDPRLRRDAAALEALTMLRSPLRAEHMAGRGRLGELAAEDPALMRRPEVQLAYGLSLTATFETAAALKQLSEAAAAFASRGDENRWQSACVALAACWARHAEWADTPAELRVRAPGSPEEARRVRREQIEAVRGRLEGLAGATASLEQVDLILARLLLDAEDTRAAGVALLERLAGTGAWAGSAEACLTLAALYERQRRWEDALALYERAESGGDGQLVARAREGADAIRRPRLVLEAAPMIGTGAPARVGLRARNVERVELEVRRVDLEGWLVARRGVFDEAALPVDGALAAAHSLETRVDRPHDWWHSGEEGALAAALPPGPYVLLARATGGRAGEVAVRRLLLVSDLRATVFIGRGKVAIWATAAEVASGREPVDPAQAAARFWMHGSFVPLQVPLPRGAALVPLPPESRVLRDRGWTCLVQAGPHVALCRGELGHETDAARDTARVILAAAPPDTRAGQTVRFLGLLRERGDSALPPTAEEVRLELRDVRDVVRLATPLSVTPAGTFLAELAVPMELAGQTLNAVVLRGPRTIENVRGRLAVRVRSLDETPLTVRLRAPRVSPPQGPPPSIEVAAAYPWGTVPADARAYVHFRALRLPVPAGSAGVLPVIEGQPAWAAAGPVEVRARLDANGRARLVVPLGRLVLPGAGGDELPPPAAAVAYGAWADVYGPDGRGARASAEFLRADSAPAVWITLASAEGSATQKSDAEQSAAPPAARFGVHWFDPGGALDEDARELVIRRGRLEPAGSGDAPALEEVARLPLFPAVDGLRSELWRPDGVGAALAALPVGEGNSAQRQMEPTQQPERAGWKSVPHDLCDGLVVEAVLPVRGGEAIRLARTFALPPAGEADVTRLDARWAGTADRPRVSVRVTGGATGSKLLLCEADELLAVHPLTPGAADQEIHLPLKGGRAAHAQVLLVTRWAEGVRVERMVPVQEREEGSIRLELNPTAARVRPATRVMVRAECRTAEGRPADAQLSARLVDLRGGSTVPWVPGDVRRARLPATAAIVSTGFRVAPGDAFPGQGPGPRATNPSSERERGGAGADGEPEAAATAYGLEGGTTGPASGMTSGPLVAGDVLLPAAINAAMVERATVWLDSRNAANGAAVFEVPIPPEAGLYRLWVIAQTWPDHAVIASADLDAREGPSIVCDLPAHMTVGDRTLAALTLTSEREWAEVDVAVRSSRELRLESLSPAARAAGAADPAASLARRVALRASEPHTLVAPLEATAAGAAQVEFDVAIGGVVQTVTAPAVVHPAEVAGSDGGSQTGGGPASRTAPAPIRVRRSLMLLSQVYTEEDEADPAVERPRSKREWLTSPLPADGRLLPGQIVLVREEFELAEPLEHVVWSQRLPPTWHTFVPAEDSFPPPGTPGVRRLEAVSWSTPRLRAGARMYEYAVAAVRPGAALLPAPQVSAGGESVPVDCTPEDLRTVVAGPQ